MIRILFFGDIVAKPGRLALAALLPALKKEFAVDLTIVNGENLAHGKGVTEKTLAEIKAAGVDLVTSGNHIWGKQEALTMIDDAEPYVLRPENYPPGCPGTGVRLLTVGKVSVLVVNLLGRVFMHEHPDCPFRTMDAVLERFKEKKPAVILVDLHAEATSEKIAFGRYMDGRITAMVGTHTHVPTDDLTILPKGTAYVTDLGMTGLVDSVIGANYEAVLSMFLRQMPRKDMHDTPETGLVRVNAVLIEADPKTGRATKIERISREVMV